MLVVVVIRDFRVSRHSCYFKSSNVSSYILGKKSSKGHVIFFRLHTSKHICSRRNFVWINYFSSFNHPLAILLYFVKTKNKEKKKKTIDIPEYLNSQLCSLEKVDSNFSLQSKISISNYNFLIFFFFETEGKISALTKFTYFIHEKKICLNKKSFFLKIFHLVYCRKKERRWKKKKWNTLANDILPKKGFESELLYTSSRRLHKDSPPLHSLPLSLSIFPGKNLQEKVLTFVSQKIDLRENSENYP